MDPKKPKITPRQLDVFTEPVTDIYRALENEIFLLIAKRLKTSKDITMDTVLEWQVDKLNQLQMVNNETIRALSKATGMAEKEIRKAISETGIVTIDSIDHELKDIYPPLPPPSHIDQILASYVNQTFREIDNFVNQTLISTNYGEGTVTKMYRKIVEETTGKVLAGTTTVNKAIAETVIKWADRGVETSFVDRGGYTWSMERYAQTVIRSTVNRTYNDLRMSRMDEYGVDLVLMSSHAAARPACAPIQGTVVSTERNPSNPKYKSIYDYGYGTPAGVRGIHCAHIFYPFVEGVNTNNQPQIDEEDADERYQQQQKQRYYERQVRKAKRSLKIAEEVGDEESILKYKKLVRNRQARVREFISEYDLPRRYENERVIV
ncbi:phage minor capsid protein [Virgibacillus halodenitrificans]|uniref:phage minor capsid protein n=1 Tax=Virgibacillus halodenitrificans TaxID=1482 RepID=UPI0002E7F29A|nr:phage minor capsid protein [Virgibacillus halodenitrificans]